MLMKRPGRGHCAFTAHGAYERCGSGKTLPDARNSTQLSFFAANYLLKAGSCTGAASPGGTCHALRPRTLGKKIYFPKYQSVEGPGNK